MLVFLVALVAVGARIFLPSDMAAPAPISELEQPAELSEAASLPVAEVPSSLEVLVKGLPLDVELDAF
ncbi:MAG: hypothetical protein EDM05_024125 [Leptolyngbya sp. IPPAS B-1204]